MAVIDDLKTYYKDLLILQYLNKTKARETIDVLADIGLMDLLPIDIKDGFDIDNAVGVQLDLISKYLGVTRFTYGDFSTVDDDFRTVLKLVAIKNNSSSDLFTIQKLLKLFFPNTEILVFDYKTMQMGYYINSDSISSDLADIIVSSGLLPVPMAVALAATIYSNDIDKFFGMRSYQLVAVNVSPFNTYDDYNMISPWLSYADAL